MPVLFAVVVAALLIYTAGASLRPPRAVVVQPALPTMHPGATAATPGLRVPDVEPEVEATAAVMSATRADGSSKVASEQTAPGDTSVRPAARRNAAAPPSGDGRMVQAAGWIEPQPHHHACSALTSGVIAEVLALEGDVVERGEVIARLIADELSIEVIDAEAAVAAAEADRAAARAELEAAEEAWAHPVERRRAVTSTAAELAETEAEIDRLPAEVEAARARHERLMEEVARARDARDRGAATEFELLMLEKDAAAQAAEVKVLEGKAAVLRAQRDRLQSEHDAALRHAELRTEESRRVALARAAVQAAEAALHRSQQRLALARLHLDRTEIRAPIAGVVQRRLKSPGDRVTLDGDDPQSAQIALLYDPAHLQVRVDVPLADAAAVFVGQRCEVSVEVLPEVTFAGVVTRVMHEADLQKNTLQVKVQVLEPDPLLRPEMLSRVRFLPQRHDPGAGGGVTNQAREVDRPNSPTMRRDAGSATTATAAALPERHEVLIDRRSLSIDGSADELNSDRPTAAPRAVAWVVRERREDRGRAYPVSIELMSPGDPADVSRWVTVRGEVRPGDLVIIDPAGLQPGARVKFDLPAASAVGGADSEDGLGDAGVRGPVASRSALRKRGGA